MKSYISGDQIMVKRAFWDPNANNGLGGEFHVDTPQSMTLAEYIESMETRLKKLEDDFFQYILLEKKE